MNILLTGANGQLGVMLQGRLSSVGAVHGKGSSELDITQVADVAQAFDALQPDLVINAAAYTAVDKAESDSAQATAVNHLGARHLAEQCAARGVRLIQVSTDFVFDGMRSTPYPVDAPCSPLGVYGHSKRDGELAVAELLPARGVVIRTAWLYSAHGANFMKTMLRLMAERAELNVVCDQVGTPTSVSTLAELIVRVAEDPDASGMLHWTDAGVASWYDFAVAIYEEATRLGLLNKPVQINPILSSAYPTPAKRPAFSVLDKSESYARYAMAPVHWRVELRAVLAQIAANNSSN